MPPAGVAAGAAVAGTAGAAPREAAGAEVSYDMVGEVTAGEECDPDAAPGSMGLSMSGAPTPAPVSSAASGAISLAVVVMAGVATLLA